MDKYIIKSLKTRDNFWIPEIEVSKTNSTTTKFRSEFYDSDVKFHSKKDSDNYAFQQLLKEGKKRSSIFIKQQN